MPLSPPELKFVQRTYLHHKYGYYHASQNSAAGEDYKERPLATGKSMKLMMYPMTFV